MVYKLGPFTKACKKLHALGSERNSGKAKTVPGGLRVRRVDDDRPVSGVRDHAADRLCGVAALYPSGRGRDWRSKAAPRKGIPTRRRQRLKKKCWRYGASIRV